MFVEATAPPVPPGGRRETAAAGCREGGSRGRGRVAPAGRQDLRLHTRISSAIGLLQGMGVAKTNPFPTMDAKHPPLASHEEGQ